ncbi:MAG TPA: hypothetical protein VJK90_15925, partial [Acetobacteraceae bacterium]|nr:hypothetical protein [Acetobacteraceae bacterium]
MGDIEASCGDVGESEPPCMRDEPAQPRARPATGVENADRARSGSPQVVQLRLKPRPKTPIRIGMQAVEAEQALGIAVGIGDIVVTGLVVDGCNIVDRGPV